jgi:hypothetical protein
MILPFNIFSLSAGKAKLGEGGKGWTIQLYNVYITNQFQTTFVQGGRGI